MKEQKLVIVATVEYKDSYHSQSAEDQKGFTKKFSETLREAGIERLEHYTFISKPSVVQYIFSVKSMDSFLAATEKLKSKDYKRHIDYHLDLAVVDPAYSS